MCFRVRYDRQRTLAIRIAAITLASDSAITLAQFRPSKLRGICFLLAIFDRKEVAFLGVSKKSCDFAGSDENCCDPPRFQEIRKIQGIAR